jgi:hypothetical protein
MIYKKHLPSCSCCILVASSVLGNDVDSCELKNGEKKKRWVSLGLVGMHAHYTIHVILTSPAWEAIWLSVVVKLTVTKTGLKTTQNYLRE